MDYKAVRSHVAEMNRHVIQLKKDSKFKNDQAKKLISDFMTTYKSIQLWIREPLDSFASGAAGKAIKVEALYEELQGWYSGITLFDEHLNRGTKIKSDTESKFDDLKKVVKIKKKHGGARPGAGRKSIGVKKHMAVTMPQELWSEIDNLIQDGKFASYSEYFRYLAAAAKSLKK